MSQTLYHKIPSKIPDNDNNESLHSNGMETGETRWRVPSLLLLLLISSAVILFMVDIFQLQFYITPTKIRTKIEDKYSNPNFIRGFTIKTPGCRIPYMDPFDDRIKKFIKQEPKIKCNNGRPALVGSNMTSIFLNEPALNEYNVTSVTCCYRAFYRREPTESENDDRVKYSKKCVKFNRSTNISDEFIEVSCKSSSAPIYKDFFSFVPIKAAASPTQAPTRKPLNILMIGIDSVSRINFHRQMPKTLNYLIQNLSAVELMGYNKVADNTHPNLVTVLSGLNETELQKLCWSSEVEKKTVFDACPFIWKEYKKRQYVTSFGEDCTSMGIFNLRSRGFKKQPTDYMYGVFDRISQREIGNSHDMNVDQCMGSRMTYKIFLDYIKNFVVKLDGAELSYFGFFWSSSLSHDYLNKPKWGDGDFYELFKYFNENNHLNNTVLVVMSDHGIRWGDIRQTFQGKMEERLPFVFMVLPDWYTRQYKNAYNNLLKNARRLTTPFDLHETLLDLSDPFNLTIPRSSPDSRSFSLFEEISPKRSCESAGIAPHWCTCQQSQEISLNDSLVVSSAHFTVDYMNLQLQNYDQCATLLLDGISDARMMSPSGNISGKGQVEDLMITLKTVPGEGVFEATVRATPEPTLTYHYEIMGTISRLNLYRQQSVCIADFHLKLYCYCKDFKEIVNDWKSGNFKKNL